MTSQPLDVFTEREGRVGRDSASAVQLEIAGWMDGTMDGRVVGLVAHEPVLVLSGSHNLV